MLTDIRWHGADQLDQARLGSSNLQDSRVRNLLVTLNGVDQELTDADLRGVNLAGATFHRINLTGANLKGATLARAALHGANLMNAQCVGTDFTGAHLTGACLEAWNIDNTTVLQDIDCDYVFLRAKPDGKGNRERRPHNPDKVFQPGDFEKFFREVLDTVQLLIRQGIHPQVFKDTLKQLMADYDLSADAVRSYERKGEDVLVTVAVPEGTDKGQFEQDFDELQALKLEAAKAQGLLEGERKRADTLEAILLKHGPATNTVHVNNTAMNNSQNPSISASDGSFVNTGDNLQGNVINLGEISGQVSNQINQLPDNDPSADQRSLKDLLTQLQAAVEADAELSDVEKKEALENVGKLAEAGTQPQDNVMQRMAKRAADNLRSITEPLTEASNLATVCKSLLPLILAVF
ncbi:MAG: pentapeptide repeat-containing protein [Leptolyngbyaceae cyanobacterium]